MNQINSRRFKGEYAPDGKQRRRDVRAEAGHRCIRCGHPFENGKHGKGEWSPCDEQCSHKGPVRILLSRDHGFTGLEPTVAVGELIADGSFIEAQWRVLTVHHLDGDKSNDQWWNTLPLCQRCHLQVQTRVDPEIPYFLEHSSWFKPYAAGFYAWKYEGRQITREQAETEMDRLLAHEWRTQP